MNADETTGPAVFRVGELYSNDAISSHLGVGNAGGVRPNLNADGSVRRLVLLTALPTARVAAENPYHDRVEGDVLVYTGKGLRGDQQPGGLNRRLTEQLDRPFPVWCFQQQFSRRKAGGGHDRWGFLGLLTLIRYHREQQLDAGGQLRTVWLFEFDIAGDLGAVAVEQDRLLATRPAFGRTNDSSEQAVERIEPQAGDDAVERTRSRLLGVHPAEFEHTVKRALDASGYREVTVTRYSQDGGSDVVASFGASGWPVSSWRVQVQAKRWLHTVGRKEVAELRGSVRPNGLGCLITTSHFSKAAVAEAGEAGKSPVTLVNGYEFASLLNRLGVSHAETAA